MKKIDLHTHSILSYDGGIDEDGYKELLQKNIIDYIAVTDHNEIAFAKHLNKKLGEAIIIGEEIMTNEGEIIGLYITEKIKNGLSVIETIKKIKEQGGIVYIPHPFEQRRKGLSKNILEQIVKDIDIVEIFNGRGFGRDKKDAVFQFLNTYHLLRAASSDAHSKNGVGTSFTAVTNGVKKDTINYALQNSTLHMSYAPISTYASPAINKLKKYFL